MTTRAVLLIALVAACGPKPAPVTGSGAGTGTAAGAGDSAPVIDWAASGVDWTKVPAPGAEPAFTPPVPEAFALNNGVNVLLVENRRLPLVSIRVIHTRAGAREDGARAGLAALTAELLDEGAGALDALALPEAIEQLGASLDTGVASDASSVWLDTLATTLDDSLALLADVVLRPRLAAADFARVKADTIEELKLRPQEPRRVASVVFDRIVMGNHPYATPGSGYVGTVEKLTLDDVRTFWKRHYVPAHATIVVVGDVDRATLQPMLERRFGGWKGKRLPAAKVPPGPRLRTPGIAFVDRPGAPQSVVMVGRPGPRAGADGFFPAEVINQAIGGSYAARLNHRLRVQLGYTYGAFAQFWRGEHAGTWSVVTSLRTDVTAAGIKEILAILDDVRTNELPAAELAKAKLQMTRELPQGFETNAGIASRVSSLVVQRLPVDWYGGYVEGVRAVTAADARAAAATRFELPSIVVVGDWAAVGGDLEALGLPVVRYDVDGNIADGGDSM